MPESNPELAPERGGENDQDFNSAAFQNST